jgi:hypothetical protein
MVVTQRVDLQVAFHAARLRPGDPVGPAMAPGA